MQRYKLKRHILSAWHTVIRDAYNIGLINSERALQHYFCIELKTELTKADWTRQIFFEPSFSDLMSGKRHCPDVVICDSKKIVAVIELKFCPRGRPETSKDMETLQWFASNCGTIELKNKRHNGPVVPSPVYSMAEDAVLSWAGIYSGPAVRLDSPAEHSNFLAMHALTSRDEAPPPMALAGGI